MSALEKKIDFAVIINVEHANPNGDPLNGNRPRYDYNGFGEISDVAIKRKLRNRLMQEGHAIFVQSDDSKIDNYPSLMRRAEGEIAKDAWKDDKAFRAAVCAKWLDVRAFGQLFAYSQGKAKGEGVSVGIRGPVSVHPAFSVVPVLDRVSSTQITKSVSGEGDGGKRASDTMGMKHRVDHGVYLFYGSINPQLASRTGFAAEDAAAIKEALLTLFRNDASSARPEGSMEVYKLYWWEHNCPNGQYSSAKVHRLLTVAPKQGLPNATPNSINDYEITLGTLPGLDVEVLDGE
jgi:CRISPR-associated protein Csd2